MRFTISGINGRALCTTCREDLGDASVPRDPAEAMDKGLRLGEAIMQHQQRSHGGRAF